MQQKQDMKAQQVAIASLAQLRQNERLLTGGEGDNKRRRHSGNYSEFGKITLADITEKSHSLYQSFVVWFSTVATRCGIRERRMPKAFPAVCRFATHSIS